MRDARAINGAERMSSEAFDGLCRVRELRDSQARHEEKSKGSGSRTLVIA